jgi:hypothetical protein
MPILRNPLIEEAFNRRFFTRPAIALTATHLALHFVILLSVWPRTVLADSILFGNTPSAFRVIAVFSYLSLSVINGILGAEPFGEKRGYRNVEWLRLGPVSLKAFLIGKITASFLHACLITLLSLPFLLLAGAASGVGIPTVFVAAAATLAFVFPYRIMALGLRLFLDERFFSLYLMLSILLILMIFATAAVHPPLNPIFVLSRLDSQETLLVTNTPPAPAGLAGALALHAAVLILFLTLSLFKAWKMRREFIPRGGES